MQWCQGLALSCWQWQNNVDWLRVEVVQTNSCRVQRGEGIHGADDTGFGGNAAS